MPTDNPPPVGISLSQFGPATDQCWWYPTWDCNDDPNTMIHHWWYKCPWIHPEIDGWPITGGQPFFTHTIIGYKCQNTRWALWFWVLDSAGLFSTQKKLWIFTSDLCKGISTLNWQIIDHQEWWLILKNFNHYIIHSFNQIHHSEGLMNGLKIISLNVRHGEISHQVTSSHWTPLDTQDLATHTAS